MCYFLYEYEGFGCSLHGANVEVEYAQGPPEHNDRPPGSDILRPDTVSHLVSSEACHAQYTASGGGVVRMVRMIRMIRMVKMIRMIRMEAYLLQGIWVTGLDSL